MKNIRLYKTFFLLSLGLVLNIACVFALKSSNCSEIAISQSHYFSLNSIMSLSANSLSINGTLLDINKSAKNKMPSTKTGLSDSTESPNTIKVWENATGDILITLKLKDRDQRIKITVWNMLGKIVIEDYEGGFKDLDNEHIIKESNFLNRGAYLIRVQGEKCRLDAKFIKSR